MSTSIAASDRAGAVLTIDLSALVENYRKLSAQAPRAECAAVIKADAYGLGVAAVGPALHAAGCETFFIATVGEGLVLRRYLPNPDSRIFVLNGIPPGAEDECETAGLIPVINSVEQLGAWRKTAHHCGKTLRAALQVDSGMSRLGMSSEQVARVSATPELLADIEVVLVMSHLACADEPDHPANAAQRLEFERLSAMLPPAPQSLANSSGIFLGAKFHYDVVRPGIALYGVNPLSNAPNPMARVVGLAAKVIQIRTIQPQTGVGYGHDFHANKSTQLATISVGYADGWPRNARLSAFFEGVELPFVGRVSMDSIVLDISALAPGRLSPGNLVDLIFDAQPVDDVAKAAGTIGYEILTGLGQRLYRNYIG